MKRLFKQLFFTVVCVMALAIVASCDKENAEGDTGYFVDLGLPSGTKWKTENEVNPNDVNNFYTYDEAMETFGSQLPTKAQFEELISECQLTWVGNDHCDLKLTGHSGKSIILHAAGYRNCLGSIYNVGSDGVYWSSTPYDTDYVFLLFLYSGRGADMDCNYRCNKIAVRLVQN